MGMIRPTLRAMRIVHLIARLNDGGPARVLREWYRHSQAMGHQLRIVCGRCAADEPDLSERWRDEGLSVDVLPELGRSLAPWRDGVAALALRRHLAWLQPDLVHTHTAKAGVLGRWAAQSLGLPCLHSYHGHVLSGYWGWPINTLLASIERCCAYWGHCHSLSPRLVHELSQVHRIGCARRWHCLPIPIAGLQPPAQGRAQVAAAIGWRDWQRERATVCFLGRLVPVKDPLLFVETLRAVAEQLPIQVLVAGDGPLRGAVAEALNAAALPHYCSGFIPAAQALAMSDCLLLSSRNEGTPLTIIEAASCRVPVVACAVGGIRDLPESPFLRRVARNPTTMATATVQALTSPRGPIAAPAAALLAAHDPQRVTARYLNLYQRIIAQG